MRINTACLSLFSVFLGSTHAFAQDQNEVARIVEAFFQGGYTAPWEATSTCPGEDALNDAIMAELIRPRNEEETQLLSGSWGVVPACRIDQVMRWYDQATTVITSENYARPLARGALSVDSTAALRLLRRAAADPSIPDGARGGYQSLVFFRLGAAEQVDLYIETFERGIQVGMYRNRSLGRLVMRPDDGPDNAMRLLLAVLEAPENDGGSYTLGVVLSVASKRFSQADRQRIWDFLEPRLGSMPHHMRDTIIKGHEELLKAGPGSPVLHDDGMSTHGYESGVTLEALTAVLGPLDVTLAEFFGPFGEGQEGPGAAVAGG